MFYMKYVQRIAMIVAVVLVSVMGMTTPVMANPSSATTPPQLITLAPISLSTEMREKYSEQSILVKVKATILETGIIGGDIKVVTSSGDESFDKSVTDAIQQSVFNPAYSSDHKAIACSFVLPLHVKVEKYLPEAEVSKETLQPTDSVVPAEAQ